MAPARDEPEHTLAAYIEAIKVGVRRARVRRPAHRRRAPGVRARPARARTSNGRGLVSTLELDRPRGPDWGSWKAPRQDAGRWRGARRRHRRRPGASAHPQEAARPWSPTPTAGSSWRSRPSTPRGTAAWSSAARRSCSSTSAGPATPEGPVRVMSFSLLAVRRMRQLAPAVPRVFLMERRARCAFRDGSLPPGVDVAGVAVDVLKRHPAYAERLRERGHGLHVWTVDRPGRGRPLPRGRGRGRDHHQPAGRRARSSRRVIDPGPLAWRARGTRCHPRRDRRPAVRVDVRPRSVVARTFGRNQEGGVWPPWRRDGDRLTTRAETDRPARRPDERGRSVNARDAARQPYVARTSSACATSRPPSAPPAGDVRRELGSEHLPAPLLDDVEVVLSELMGNAVRHAAPHRRRRPARRLAHRGRRTHPARHGRRLGQAHRAAGVVPDGRLVVAACTSSSAWRSAWGVTDHAGQPSHRLGRPARARAPRHAPPRALLTGPRAPPGCSPLRASRSVGRPSDYGSAGRRRAPGHGQEVAFRVRRRRGRRPPRRGSRRRHARALPVRLRSPLQGVPRPGRAAPRPCGS